MRLHLRTPMLAPQPQPQQRSLSQNQKQNSTKIALSNAAKSWMF